MNIRVIASYLAGKLPPYYGDSNLRKFSKILQKLFPERYTKDEILFSQRLVNNNDEKFYFNILDNLYQEDEDKFYRVIKELKIPDDVLEQAGINVNKVKNNDKVNKETIQQIALYLSGQYPGQFILPDKLKILYKIREKDDTNFSDKFVKLLHGKSDLEYFSTLLNAFLEKHGEEEFIRLLEEIEIPNDIYNLNKSKIMNSKKIKLISKLLSDNFADNKYEIAKIFLEIGIKRNLLEYYIDMSENVYTFIKELLEYLVKKGNFYSIMKNFIKSLSIKDVDLANRIENILNGNIEGTGTLSDKNKNKKENYKQKLIEYIINNIPRLYFMDKLNENFDISFEKNSFWWKQANQNEKEFYNLVLDYLFSKSKKDGYYKIKVNKFFKELDISKELYVEITEEDIQKLIDYLTNRDVKIKNFINTIKKCGIYKDLSNYMFDFKSEKIYKRLIKELDKQEIIKIMECFNLLK